ncbi:hypothetical protein [Streptomyces sp. TLI_185]|uniref:hypothetical protein n=1 Tax=Streptomyces sp. TLI_185 TaxID=2485151 RepID=UPI000F4E8287|nr:hypothetical protein [Streptomyces sp. TLI_185]
MGVDVPSAFGSLWRGTACVGSSTLSAGCPRHGLAGGGVRGVPRAGDVTGRDGRPGAVPAWRPQRLVPEGRGPARVAGPPVPPPV